MDPIITVLGLLIVFIVFYWIFQIGWYFFKMLLRAGLFVSKTAFNFWVAPLRFLIWVLKPLFRIVTFKDITDEAIIGSIRTKSDTREVYTSI